MFGLAVCILIDMFTRSVKVSKTLMSKADTSKMPLAFFECFWSLLRFTGHKIDALDNAFILKKACL